MPKSLHQGVGHLPRVLVPQIQATMAARWGREKSPYTVTPGNVLHTPVKPEGQFPLPPGNGVHPSFQQKSTAAESPAMP